MQWFKSWSNFLWVGKKPQVFPLPILPSLTSADNLPSHRTNWRQKLLSLFTFSTWVLSIWSLSLFQPCSRFLGKYVVANCFCFLIQDLELHCRCTVFSLLFWSSSEIIKKNLKEIIVQPRGGGEPANKTIVHLAVVMPSSFFRGKSHSFFQIDVIADINVFCLYWCQAPFSGQIYILSFSSQKVSI